MRGNDEVTRGDISKELRHDERASNHSLLNAMQWMKKPNDERENDGKMARKQSGWWASFTKKERKKKIEFNSRFMVCRCSFSF
jgi:hypothetical protein